MTELDPTPHDFDVLSSLQAKQTLWADRMILSPEDDTSTYGAAASALELDPFSLPVRQSHIKTYSQCPRKYLFMYRFGLRPKSFYDKPSADIGTLIHILYTARYEGVTPDIAIQRCYEHIDTIMTAYEAAPRGDFESDPASYRTTLEQRVLLARTMHDIYCEIVPRDPNLQLISVEEEISVHSESLGRQIAGRIDKIMQDENGKIWLYDLKTTMSPLKTFGLALKWDPQVWLYRALAVAKFGYERVAGFIHPMLRRTQLQIGQQDRPFERYEHTFKSGPRKGLTETRKRYTSDTPLYENYLARVRDQFLARGDYQLEASKRLADPWIRESRLAFHGIQVAPREMTAKLLEVSKASRAKTQLWRFPRASREVCLPMVGNACPFLHLCGTSSANWGPERRQRYVQVRLDKEILRNADEQ